MKTIKSFIQGIFFSILILALFTNCASKKNLWGDPETGLNLHYRMPEKEVYQYRISSDIKQSMEVMGQKMDVETDALNLFTLESQGMENNINRFNVTIDTCYLKIITPRGEMSPDMSGVMGHGFPYLVSSVGKELDYSGAEDLKYNLGEYADLNISSDFQTLFPDLPGNIVKVGESWNDIDTLVEKSGSGTMEFITSNRHEMVGLETFQGHDCVRIKSTFTGTITGTGTMQGVATKTTGSIKGESTWFFAYKDGIFVNVNTDGVAETTTEASGEGRSVTIPSTRDYVVVVDLVENKNQ